MYINFNKFWETVKDKEVCHDKVHRVISSQTLLKDSTRIAISMNTTVPTPLTLLLGLLSESFIFSLENESACWKVRVT